MAEWDTPEALRDLTPADLVELIAAAERLSGYLASAQRRAAVSLERRQPMAEKLQAVSAADRDVWSGRDVTSPSRLRTFRVAESASDEIAMRLCITRPAAARLLGEGKRLRGCLAPVGHALTAGELSPPELERRARAAVLTANPERGRQRHERAKAYRRLSPVRALADGMASLTLTTTITAATAVHACADAAARAARRAGDDRTLPQLRADVLATIAQHALSQGTTLPEGSVAAGPAIPTLPAEIPTLPAEEPDTLDVPVVRQRFSGRQVRTLRVTAELAESPPSSPLPEGTGARCGWDAPVIAGSGAVDHATGRALAQHPPRWLSVVHLTDRDRAISVLAAMAPEDRYLPSDSLRAAINAAFPTCIAPACAVPANLCQPDHLVPYPEGKTGPGNVYPLCQRHHTLKTHAGHDYSVDETTGTVDWITAIGQRYLRTPGGTTERAAPADLPVSADRPP